MKKIKDIFHWVLLILFGLAFEAQVWAQSLSAEFEGGRVLVTGSASFECIPDHEDWASMATVVRAPFVEQVYSGSTNIYVNAYDEYVDCSPPGTILIYWASYAGGLLYDKGGPEPVCLLGGSTDAYASVTVPPWPEIIVHHPVDIVSGLTDIEFTYEFFQHYVSGKRIVVSLKNGQQIYDAQDLPLNGTILTSYDFTGKKGFILLKFQEFCAAQSVVFEKLLYTEPEDSCEDKVGKPVSVSSGKVYAAETDFTLKGLVPLTFTRYYDSGETIPRDFGVSWSHGYDTRVISFGSNTCKVINPDGSDVYYMDNDNDKVYQAEFPKGAQSSLVKNSNGSFTRDFFDGSKEEFNKWGYLTSIQDWNGNRLTLARDSLNKLTKIIGPFGREIHVAYTTGNKISSVTVPDGSMAGRVYSYTYLPSGHLAKVVYPDSSERNYEYVNISNIGYRLSGVRDENGNYIEKHTYDAKGRAVTSSADGANELLSLDYIDDTHTKVTDSLGNVTTYTIGKTMGRSHSTGVSGPGCRECGQGDTVKTYDDNLNETSRTDANGNVTAMTYDTNGNMLTKTEAVGTVNERTTAYTYNDFGQILSITDNDGNTVRYFYDDNGNVTEEIDAHGHATTHTYGTFNEKLSTTDRNGNTTTFTYDLYGNLSTMTNELGHKTAYTYDVIGNMVSMTDPNGNTTTYDYDIRDRLIKETRPDGSQVMHEYDDAGNKTAATDSAGGRTEFSYNARNILTKTTGPEGSKIEYAYDTENNMTSMTTRDSSDHILTSENYTYDNHNRLTKTIYADGTFTERTYDNLGNVLARKDENGNVTTYTYDSLNRLTSVVDAAGGITSYTYDSRDNLTSSTDANGNTTYYIYDSLNRLILTTSPDTGTTTYAYDANGNILTKTDASGMTTSYSYDALDRQTSIHFPDASQDIYFFYDDDQTENSAGKLTSMTDPSGTTWYEYDTTGRVTAETRRINGLEYRTGYTYDSNGNVAMMTYPGGRQITYSYDQRNKATSVSEIYLGETRTLAENITYLPSGEITSMTFGNGIRTLKAFDSRNRLNSMNIGTMKQFAYSRDNTGNITVLSDAMIPADSKIYTYDALNRLTIANGPWGAITYAYDPAGNRTYETSDTGNTVYNYTANTHKLASSEGEKPYLFTYDSNGNTTGENSRQYIYSQNQRLIQALEGEALIGEYVYNGKGQRAMKYTNNRSWCRIFHYDKDGMLLAESSSTGTIRAEYVYINGQPMAKIEGNSVYYYHNDHLGTPILMTDSSGQVVSNGEFLPFGELLSITGSVTNNLRFPGQYYDEETGLHQNWFRDYKAETGRYLEGDPILLPMTNLIPLGCAKGTVTWYISTLMLNPQMLHSYVYAVGNPVMFDDPKGQNIYGNWCGPGGSGPAKNWVDECCKDHDNCYQRSGASWKNSIFGTGGTEKQDCIKECDKELCKCLKRKRPMNFDELALKQEVAWWFGCN